MSLYLIGSLSHYAGTGAVLDWVIDNNLAYLPNKFRIDEIKNSNSLNVFSLLVTEELSKFIQLKLKLLLLLTIRFIKLIIFTIPKRFLLSFFRSRTIHDPNGIEISLFSLLYQLKFVLFLRASIDLKKEINSYILGKVKTSTKKNENVILDKSLSLDINHLKLLSDEYMKLFVLRDPLNNYNQIVNIEKNSKVNLKDFLKKYLSNLNKLIEINNNQSIIIIDFERFIRNRSYRSYVASNYFKNNEFDEVNIRFHPRISIENYESLNLHIEMDPATELNYRKILKLQQELLSSIEAIS